MHQLRSARAAVAALLGVVLLATGGCKPPVRPANAPSPADLAFRSSVDTPPPGDSHVFKLSANYPTTLPAPCTDCTWLKTDVDFKTSFPPQPRPNAWTEGKWADYLASILTYVRQDQDPNLADEVGFRTEVAGATRWYNVPWMAYDPTTGREYRHGTTNERTAVLGDLVGPDGKRIRPTAMSLGAVHFLPQMSESCKQRFPNGFETWAVGYYNPQGGYAIGKSIPKDGVPKTADYMGSPIPAGLPFPQGAMVVKVLTTNAPVDCVPYLQGAPEWRVNRHVLNPATKNYMCKREVQVSRVVQVDVAVADSRSPTGWVYGTYAYNGTQPGATFWDRLTPLGVQWGADPWTFPAVPNSESQPLQQSVANPGVSIFEHMGCRGRLAGPVDNPGSSCMSCHASAYAAKPGAQQVMGTNTPPSFGFDGLCQAYSADNAAYFQNVRPPQGYRGGKFPADMSLDTSLQLWVALQQYGQFATAKAPQACVNPGA
jgi:hypothetical protein